MPSTKPKIVIRTDNETIEKFNTIAENENRSMSNLGETLIKKYIHDYEKNNGDIASKSMNINGSNINNSNISM